MRGPHLLYRKQLSGDSEKVMYHMSFIPRSAAVACAATASQYCCSMCPVRLIDTMVVQLTAGRSNHASPATVGILCKDKLLPLLLQLLLLAAAVGASSEKC
jgi:hypothetical protein